jgi:hypothetical protein
MTTSKQDDIQWDSQGGAPLDSTGPTSSEPSFPSAQQGRATRQTLTPDEAWARGTDGFGVPLAPSATRENSFAGDGPSGAGKGGSQSMLARLQAMESVDIADQNGLHAFTEAGRSLCMKLAILTELTSGQMKADAKKMARDNSDGNLTVGEKLKLKVALMKIGRRIHAASDDMADAAASLSGAWKVMEVFLDELENGQDTKPKAKGGFHIAGLRGQRG